MIEEIDSLQKAKMVFFAKPHVGLVKHIEGITLDEAKERIRGVLEDLQTGEYKVIEEAGEEVDKRADVIAYLVYKNSKLKLWITITERGDVGCVIEARVYHEMDESAEADEYLSLLSRIIDDRV